MMSVIGPVQSHYHEPSGRLSWLHVSFSFTLNTRYRIASYRNLWLLWMFSWMLQIQFSVRSTWRCDESHFVTAGTGQFEKIYLALFLTHYNVFVILINPQHIFLHGTGTLWCLQKEMATYTHWSVSLWRDPDNVPHCRILSPDKTEWRLILATLCGWRRCFVADQLWFMTRIREEEEEEEEAVKRTFEVLTL